MYTHNNLHAPACMRACMASRNVNGASMLDLKFQMLWGLGQRPTVVGKRPTKPPGGARMKGT